MKTCHQIETELQDYLDGQLARDESERVAAHLARCPACVALCERLRELDAALIQQVGTPALSRGFGACLMRRIELENKAALPEKRLALCKALVEPARLLDGLSYAAATATGGWCLYEFLAALARERVQLPGAGDPLSALAIGAVVLGCAVAGLAFALREQAHRITARM